MGITRSLLTARLRRLVDEGVLERVPYQDRPMLPPGGRHPLVAPTLDALDGIATELRVTGGVAPSRGRG